MRQAPLIALLTDFGAADSYAAAVRLVIAGRRPEARIIDLTHEIPPGDILAGAFQLALLAPYLPGGTVVVAVVDPGVGGSRRPLAIAAGGCCLVGPDNGLLWPAACLLGEPEVVVLDRPEFQLPTPSRTFHGRDIFAPCAAALAGGTALREIGTLIHDPIELQIPAPIRGAGGSIAGEVIYIDRFGNAITNIRLPQQESPARFIVEAPAREMEIQGVLTHYSAGVPGDLISLTGSSGYLEIAVRDGSAADIFRIQRGDAIHVRET